MSYDYTNKVAIITGASSGFGKALAKRLVGKGAKVALGDIDIKAGEALVKELGESNAAFTTCDVTKKSDQKKLFELAISKFKTIDIVCNNAGIADYKDFYTDEDGDKSSWELVMKIDLDAVITGTRMAFDYFANKLEKGGVILNTASLAGLYPQPGQPVYGTAKAGVVHLSRSVASMGATQDIHCIPICPSFSPTGILAKGVEAIGESFNDVTGDRVPVEQVIDAFVLAIENSERLNGRPIRITSAKGIDVYTFGQGKPFKL